MTARSRRRDRRYGRCPVCQSRFALYADGTVWHHWALIDNPSKWNGARCPGTRKPPLEVKP